MVPTGQPARKASLEQSDVVCFGRLNGAHHDENGPPAGQKGTVVRNTRFGRIGVATAALAVAVGTALPAGAQEDTTHTFPSTAEADAFELTISGMGASGGSTDAAGDSTPLATANGAGFLSPLGGVGETSATAEGPDQSEEVAEMCGSAPLDQVFDEFGGALVLDLACSSASASTPGGLPQALSTARVGSLEVGVPDAVADTPVGDLADQITDGLGGLEGSPGLPTLPGLPGEGELPTSELQVVIDNLADTLSNGGTLLTATIGDTASSVETTADVVSSAGEAEGAEIVVLPDFVGGPLATITLGQATADASIDRNTGDPTGAFSVAPITVALNPAVAAALGLPQSTVEVPAGETIALPLPAPLNSSITPASGEVVEEENGVAVTASAARFDIAAGLPGGGIVLGLADVAAGVALEDLPDVDAGGDDVVPPPDDAPDDGGVAPGEELPRTGGGVPALPLAPHGPGSAAILAATVRRAAVLRS